MKELILYLVQNIVDYPDDVSISESIEDKYGRQFKVYTIKCNQQDIGKVVGKNGNTIQSIRNLVKIKAIKENVFVDVRVED